METLLSEEEVRRVAKKAHDETIQEDEEWPDCFTVSQRLKELLVSECGISAEEGSDMSIYQYITADEFYHYTLYLPATFLGEEAVVDAAFAQFANETETPYGVAPAEEIRDVVVVKPAGRYAFFSDKTKRVS